MTDIAIVDYGMGNLRSVTQAVMHVAEGTGVEVVWARTPQEVMDAERVFLGEVTQESIAEYLSSGKSRGGKTSIVSPAETALA